MTHELSSKLRNIATHMDVTLNHYDAQECIIAAAECVDNLSILVKCLNKYPAVYGKIPFPGTVTKVHLNPIIDRIEKIGNALSKQPELSFISM